MSSLVSKVNSKHKRPTHRGKNLYGVKGQDNWAEYKEILRYASALAKGGMTGITEDGDARKQFYYETQ